jgi:hypothetical protein
MTGATGRPKSSRAQIATGIGVSIVAALLCWNAYANSQRSHCAKASQRATNGLGTALSSRWSLTDGCEILVKGRWDNGESEWTSQKMFEAIYLSSEASE